MAALILVWDLAGAEPEAAADAAEKKDDDDKRGVDAVSTSS